jgi:hypothetical protein
MGDFSNRRWIFLNTSETGSLDFSQIMETSSGSLRLNNSGSRTFVKYDGSMPSSVSGLSSKSAEYSHSAVLNVLTGSEWTWGELP